MARSCRSTTIHQLSYFISLGNLIFFFLTVPGCTQQEAPKKVSLFKRAGGSVQPAESLQPNTLWFGFDLRLGPKEEVKIYAPFLKYLEQATGKRFRIKFAERYEDTVENLGRGTTHFASLGTLNYIIGADRYGIRYLVSGVNKEGDPRYRAMIVTRQDSPIQGLEDMKGRCFAFGSKMSTHGYLVPRKMLERAGLSLEDLGSHRYTGSFMNVAMDVLNGECDAGSIQDTLANRLASEGKIKIIQASEPYPSSVIAYNSSVDSTIVQSVKDALLAFDPTGRQKGMLFDWDMTGMPLGFSEINDPELNKVMSLAREYGLFVSENVAATDGKGQ